MKETGIFADKHLGIYQHIKVIPRSILECYEEKMKQVKRWGDKETGALIKEENDYDHVLGMFELGNNIFNTCPSLEKVVHFSDVMGMIILHDAGEMVVGDLPKGVNISAEERMMIKNREAKALKSLIRQLPQTQRRYARHLHNRYENRDKSKTDIDAHFVKFIDAWQAVQFYITHRSKDGFNPFLMTKRQKEHARKSLIWAIEPFQRLIEALPEKSEKQEEREEITQFIQKELNNMITKGYREAENFRNVFR